MNLIPRNQMLDVDSLFNDFFPGFGRPALRTSGDGALAGMRVDVEETDKGYEIHAELPGVKKTDIDVTLHNGVLTVSASKKTEKEEKKKGKVIWRERSSGTISRSFSVDPETTEKDIKANFSDGVLTLEVPHKSADTSKSEQRRIKID